MLHYHMLPLGTEQYNSREIEFNECLTKLDMVNDSHFLEQLQGQNTQVCTYKPKFDEEKIKHYFYPNITDSSTYACDEI